MSDLDDFFRKKDKKKSKTKKFLSSEELVKTLEQAAKEQAEKQKPAKIDEEAEQVKITNKEQDDEWNEFEEEKRPDLSNLKLGQLTMNDEDDENNFNFTGNNEENENSNFASDNSENPWNKANSSAPAAPVVAKQEPIKQTGAYVPPSLLRSENAARNRINRKNAPDLQNKDFFPTLGSEKPAEPPRPRVDHGFEEVASKHSSKFQPAAAGTAPVSTGNAYSSLLSDSLDS